jgi:hypothetical protein
MVQYDNGKKDEVRDSELEMANDYKAVVTMRCPTCNTLTPHSTRGVQRDERGVYQNMGCAVCGTLSMVYGGQEGETFQENVDAPDDGGELQ